MHLETKNLPQTLQAALREIEYRRKDIRVIPETETHMSSASGNGYRAGVCVVNLETGERKTILGSWGGPNMFNPGNPVDHYSAPVEIPRNGAVITFRQGGSKPTYANLHVRPETLTPMLPAAPELSERAAGILAIFARVRGGCRSEYLQRAAVTPAEIDALVTGGYLNRNRAGAIQISTAGRNAAAKDYYKVMP